jgi:hypothetical protein
MRARVNKSLDVYAGKVLFPDKLAKTNSLLKGIKMP